MSTVDDSTAPIVSKVDIIHILWEIDELFYNRLPEQNEEYLLLCDVKTILDRYEIRRKEI